MKIQCVSINKTALRAVYILYKHNMFGRRYVFTVKNNSTCCKLNYNALGSIFFKYITNTSIEDTGCSSRVAFLYFFTKLCICKNGSFCFAYDVRTLLRALTNMYNLFFYAGMYNANMCIYAPTKFKNMWNSLQYYSTASIRTDASGCLNISAIAEHDFRRAVLNYTKDTPDILFCTNPMINTTRMRVLLQLNCCTVGLCADFNMLWYFDIGFPVLHSAEGLQFFFFELITFSIFRGLGYALSLFEERVGCIFYKALGGFVFK